ncbi:SAV_6107 family HEPN domain-containing protein [Amycolatopsis mediterranei]|uniref:SAV_6107 family HEPN domain-containing protein n=1 Tax=Amycolatopsis mediterranei TaxID=33910 RepID=UPI003F4E2940
MSVKVVSPTDPGQPELPMTLRPQPAPAGNPRGRSRQCMSAPADPRQRPSTPAADSRQPQLPILCTAASEATDATDAELRPSSSVVADSGQSELPLPALAIPEQARPAATGADSDRPEPVTPAESGLPVVSAAVESGQSELPVSEAPTPAVADEPPGLPLSLRPPGADPDQSSLPMSLRPPASPAAAGLLAQARRGLAEAAQETRPAERFIGAYLAALRGAAAVLAARGRPHRGRARPASTWVLLDSVAPELREWSAFFASNSATRAAAQAGITGKVTAESATGLVGAATPFLELVRRLVHGLPITGEAHVA